MAAAGVTLLDRLIGYISPAAGRVRVVERILLKRAYEAASPRDPWKPRRRGASANADHMADAAMLRDKARSLMQNVPYARNAMRTLVADTIGTGIMGEWPTKNRGGKEKARRWKEWCKVCDADGLRSFDALMAAAYLASEVDGEVLIRLRPRLKTDALPVPLQLQLLEIDWLDSSRNGTNGGNQIVEGIEYDPIGRRVAYYLWNQHPGDSTVFRAKLRSTRVEADSIIHYYAPERPGQARGITRFASVISYIRDLRLLQDAELARKNNESRLGVLVSGDAELLANRRDQDLTGTADSKDLGELPSGGMLALPAGVNVTTVQPQANNGFVDYTRDVKHDIAAGFGVPYEAMFGDLSGVNFSSGRMGRLKYRRDVEQTQWLSLIPNLYDRIARKFEEFGQLAGAWTSVGDEIAWTTPKWEYVNPKDDVEADLAEIAGGLASPSEKIRARGEKPERVYAELKSDFDTLRASGVLDVLFMLLKGKTESSAAAKPGTGAP